MRHVIIITRYTAKQIRQQLPNHDKKADVLPLTSMVNYACSYVFQVCVSNRNNASPTPTEDITITTATPTTKPIITLCTRILVHKTDTFEEQSGNHFCVRGNHMRSRAYECETAHQQTSPEPSKQEKETKKFYKEVIFLYFIIYS